MASKSKNPRVDSKGSDEDLQAEFEEQNQRSNVESLGYGNPSRTSLPQSTNGAISEIELGTEPETHAQRGAGSGY